MNVIFEVIDKTGRKIHLSKERWGEHIRLEHPEVREYEEIEKTLKNPETMIVSDRDDSVMWYFIYNKIRKRYLKVSVKYLNGTGYVITTHYTKKLQ